MHRSMVFGLVGLFAAVSAQDVVAPSAVPSATNSGATPTESGAVPSEGNSEPKVHTVQVGNGGFRFTPAEIKNVSVGDIVHFQFFPPDHSVVRAEFGHACVPYENTNPGKSGFFSGVKLFDDLAEVGEHDFNITVDSTDPIFYYCSAPKSCIEKLMVGVINPNEEQTLAAQILSARNSDYQLSPGEKIPSEGGSSTSAVSSPTAAPTHPPASSHSSHKLSAGAIAGIVVGAVVAIAICAALFFYVGRTKSLKDVIERKDATVKHTSMAPGAGPEGFGTPGTPGFIPASPFSPHTSEYGAPPGYGQHADARNSGQWGGSPQMHQGHMSMMSQNDNKSPKVSSQQQHYAEMPSPDPNQHSFTHELEAPNKPPGQL